MWSAWPLGFTGVGRQSTGGSGCSAGSPRPGGGAVEGDVPGSGSGSELSRSCGRSGVCCPGGFWLTESGSAGVGGDSGSGISDLGNEGAGIGDELISAAFRAEVVGLVPMTLRRSGLRVDGGAAHGALQLSHEGTPSGLFPFLYPSRGAPNGRRVPRAGPAGMGSSVRAAAALGTTATHGFVTQRRTRC